MKKLSLLFALMMVSVLCFAKNETTVCFTVNPPLVCNNCENKVKENIKFEKGVKAIKPSSKTNTIEVTYDADKTNVDNLVKRFKKIGYDATVCIPEEECTENQPACCKESKPCCAEENKCCQKSEKCVDSSVD